MQHQELNTGRSELILKIVFTTVYLFSVERKHHWLILIAHVIVST
jgi:hypothetical protein